MLEGRSLHGDAQILEWLYQAKERCRRVEAEVVGYAKVGGEPVWHVAFPGSTVCGVVPASEAGLARELMPLMVGQSIGLVVKGLDPINQVVACSRRDVVATAVRQAVGELKGGDVRNAVVRAIIPGRRKEGRTPGLLLEVARDVLVEVSGEEAATWLSLRLAEQYVPGQRVRVAVQGVDPERGAVTVSVRSALPDP